MPKVHGSKTYLSVNSVVVAGVKTSEWTRGKDKHDTTEYGPTVNDHDYEFGLGDSTLSCSGTYDSSAGTGARAVFRPLADSGAKVPVVRRPEGTGSGKPQDSFLGGVEKYVETNPVDGMVAWAADIQACGTVNSAPQA